VADPARGRIWVCEVKDPQSAFAPYTLRRHVERFTQAGGYIDKLLAKARAVADNPGAAARACGSSEQPHWRVIPLMITRRVEPAAFVPNPRIAFTVVAGLSDVIDADRELLPGHAPGEHAG